MNRAARWRLAVVLGAVLLLELLCRVGVIDRLTMPPPTIILRDFAVLMASGKMNAAMLRTLVNVVVAFTAAVVVGVLVAVSIHGRRAIREGLDPLFATYYAIPVYAFYPLFIMLFGLGEAPQILIGFMLAVVVVIVNVLTGLDQVPRVLLKAARVHGLGSTETALRITLPQAAPHLLTGVKLAVAYAFIGIIGAEFIMSNSGIGYEISFSYNNFDNATMYPLILLILLISTAVNAALSRWEKALMLRRGRQ